MTGLGPWTVTWSDGVVQTTNAAAGSGAVVVRGVLPPQVTNTLANYSTNYTFTVASVTNADMCLGNQPGDLTCTNTVNVNPRPTASLVSSQTICNGQSALVQLQADLTGLGPWTVTWSDGVVQTTNAAVGSGAVVVRGVLPPQVTNSVPNNATNYIFTVASVTNADMCLGNQPGDLTCTNTVNVNPRPTASLVSSQTICNGQSALVQLQADLTGLGPWTVTWSDGVVQTTNAAVGSGAVVVRGVSPPEVTNSLPNNATNYLFTVTGVTNADMCLGNQPGDLTCTNTVNVNPRPTASLVSSQTICNGQSALVQLQADLTGLGPWTVTWSDGVVQTTNAAVGSGAVVVRGVLPPQVTNSVPNNATNYVFTVASVTNADMCLGNQPGDLTCTNTVNVNPRPTASLVSSQTICNGQSALVQLQADLTGLGPWTVTWSDGVVQTTNAAVGSGAVVVRGVLSPQVTNTLANYPTNYVFTVASVTNTDMCLGNQPGDLTCTNTVNVNPRPTASLLSFVSTACAGDNFPNPLTNTLTGLVPWVVYWNNGLIQTNPLVTDGPVFLSRTVNPTNSYGSLLASNYAYYVTAVTNADMCAGNQPGDITGSVTNIVNPTPLDPPVLGVAGAGTDAAGNLWETNVLGRAQLLTVVDQPGYTVDWYDATQTNLLAAVTFTYAPANTNCGFFTNYVSIQDPNTLCYGSNLFPVIEVLIPPAPLSLGNLTNNALVPNPALAVSSFTNAANPAGRIVADWYDAPAAGILLATATNSYTPVATNTTTYWVGAPGFGFQPAQHQPHPGYAGDRDQPALL